MAAPEPLIVPPTYSLPVLQCAAAIQQSALEIGKHLGEAAALEFCTALDRSPNVAPVTPSKPVSAVDALSADVGRCT